MEKLDARNRYGKSIANHAPSEFITILENKVVSLGGKFEKVDFGNSPLTYFQKNSIIITKEHTR